MENLKYSKHYKPAVLICGGAGFIGSHLVREVVGHGYSVVVLDNLSKGHRESIPDSVDFELGDISDPVKLDEVLTKYKPVAVFHFCAFIEVGESCADPLKYYQNNVCATVTLLQAMRKHGISYFVFSSTAALFGMPEKIPIGEFDLQIPKNPYGDTKLAVEKMLKWCDEAYGLKSMCLRYFNACGAHESGEIGEVHDPESHLIPLVLQVPMGKRQKAYIFGDDYETEDGTCVRDYVHVTDLATAHIKALEYMMKNNKSDCFNLGSGKGYSVKEIIEAARRVTGHPIPCEVQGRRSGDPAKLVASSEKAERVLGWTRKYESIDEIVKTVWNFQRNHEHGY